MSSAGDPIDKLIWATRGRSWGFRFLLNGGLPDPLPTYESAFAGLRDDPETWHSAPSGGALRFPDPLGRRDAAGRVIPHEFVLLEDFAMAIASVADGRKHVWPLVADLYARVWEGESPPSQADLRLST